MSPPRAVVALLFLVVSAGACGAPPGSADGSDRDASRATPPEATVPDVLIPAPDLAGVELRNQGDEPVAFESLRGKPALVSFIYTRCPMPEMCPATTLRFQEVQESLSAEERTRVRLISISFDSEHDTPEVLADYAELWDVDGSFWTLLTGDADSIRRVASAYGAWYESTPDGTFDHPMMSMILLPDGALHRVLTGSAWDSAEIAGVLRDLAPR